MDRERIFKYLNRRFNVDGNIIRLKENNPKEPKENLQQVFGDISNGMYEEWCCSLTEESIYCLIYPNGRVAWYKENLRHKDNDEPALIDNMSTRRWFRDDELHRENNRPAVEYLDGRKEYWENGERIC